MFAAASREPEASEEPSRQHSDLNAGADERQSSCGGGPVHADPNHVGERRSDPRHAAQLRNGDNPTCRIATRAYALHQLVELWLELQFELGKPVESDAPLVGHRSRHMRLLSNPTEPSNTDRR